MQRDNFVLRSDIGLLQESIKHDDRLLGLKLALHAISLV
jgi:hypothetical protein